MIVYACACKVLFLSDDMAEFESLVAAAASLRLLSILALTSPALALFPVDTVNVPAHHLIDFISSRSIYLLPLIHLNIPDLAIIFLVVLLILRHLQRSFLKFTLLIQSSLLFLG